MLFLKSPTRVEELCSGLLHKEVGVSESISQDFFFSFKKWGKSSIQTLTCDLPISSMLIFVIFLNFLIHELSMSE